MMHRQSSSRGFSLVEIMVVVAVIGILAAILVILLAHQRDNATVATCETNERMIAEALDSYAVDHSGQFPSSSGPVDQYLFGGPGNPYFTAPELIDPANGKPYVYTVGAGTCQNPDAEYQIEDQGGHASSSLVALLQGDDQTDSVAFCSDRGLYAFASGSGGSANAPNNNGNGNGNGNGPMSQGQAQP